MPMGVNRQLRKVTKSKTVFPSDDSLLKTLCLIMMDITKRGQVIVWAGVDLFPVEDFLRGTAGGIINV